MSKTYRLHKPGGDHADWTLEIDGRIARLRSGEKLLKTIDLATELRRLQFHEAELVIDVSTFTADAAVLAEIAAAVQIAAALPADASTAAAAAGKAASGAHGGGRRRRRPWWRRQVTVARLLWVVLVGVVAAVLWGAYRDVARMVGWDTSNVAERQSDPTVLQTAAIGVAGPVALWSDPALQEHVKVQLNSGARLTVMPTSQARVVRAVTKRGDEGYLPRYAVCSIPEYERRKAQNEIPKQVYCIVAEGNQGAVLPLGATQTDPNVDRRRPLFAAGDGVWLDESMRGREYYIGAESVHGDPAIMFLVLPTGKLARLDVW